MLFTIIVILAVIVAILVYQIIRREIAKHATIIVRNDAEQMTDKAMVACLPVLVESQILTGPEMKFKQSETVADVWGKGVMAFEYQFDISKNSNGILLNQIRQLLNGKLKEYGDKQEIKCYKDANQAFLVTDAWIYSDKLHLDVAYIINEATYQYIYDLKKLGQKF